MDESKWLRSLEGVVYQMPEVTDLRYADDLKVTVDEAVARVK